MDSVVKMLDKQDARLLQRERAAYCILVKSGRLEQGDNISRTYRSIFNHCGIIGLQSYWIR